jgi:pyridoxal phosphate enzyme (YggS family)
MIAANIEKITQQLPAHVKLIAVTKTKPVELIQEAYNAGLRAFGENKVQEMVAKQPLLPADVEWHLIGHLQSNKVKYMAEFVHLIHSVDSLKLLQTINKEAAKHHRVIDCLLQIYIAQEDTKFGLSEDELLTLLQEINTNPLPHVRICGLMGMASNTDNEQQIEHEFKSLKNLHASVAEQLKQFTNINHHFTTVSMGMSSDYALAIACGSNMVRVGSAIFGNRN